MAGEMMRGSRKTMKVMVAMDDSECSFNALKWALDHLFVTPPEMGTTVLAEEPNPVEADMLVLVHVQQPFQHYGFPAGPAVYATTSVVESVRKAQEENSAILMSQQMHMDLLVVGSRGLGTIKRAFLGSVSDYCAHHAKCPILIVRPPKETAVPTTM
ncbi:hypothetical protein F8388_013370 [Cannabis sativa]|uniref:UspA domain-containing protein n=1 Tax=Cannabis sativa TaxID=3483 RepID=A0A7J6I4Y8_CANSA|nr:hypothetical protein F8388_013370 [Cannabis sativa]KAF4402396.1 hypothetical protein G4B88_012181 [Cannabis sativa]